jgi:hypothetical protein
MALPPVFVDVMIPLVSRPEANAHVVLQVCASMSPFPGCGRFSASKAVRYAVCKYGQSLREVFNQAKHNELTPLLTASADKSLVEVHVMREVGG